MLEKGVRPIKEEWDVFEKEVMPNDAGEGQRSDMKMAFYAGAIACYEALIIDTSKLSDEASIIYLDMVRDDLAIFAKEKAKQSKVDITEALMASGLVKEIDASDFKDKLVGEEGGEKTNVRIFTVDVQKLRDGIRSGNKVRERGDSKPLS